MDEKDECSASVQGQSERWEECVDLLMEQRWQRAYSNLWTKTLPSWPLFSFSLIEDFSYTLLLFPLAFPNCHLSICIPPCIHKYLSHHLWLIFSKSSAFYCYSLSYSEDAGTSTLCTQRKFPSNNKITFGYKNRRASPRVQMYALTHTHTHTHLPSVYKCILACTQTDTCENRCSHKACKIPLHWKTPDSKK